MELFETVKEKVISSVKWTALIEVVSKAAPPLIFIVLARLLTPTDFGVVATAMIAISFSQIFCEAGLSQALVQTSEPLEKAANVVFWLNLVFGVLVYQILFFTAPLAADFFHSPASLSVIRVLGLQIVINTLTSVQQALLVRDMGFRQLFWVKLATVFVPGLFSIPLALSGFGVWALVAGALAGSILNLILLWARSSWRPRWEFDRLMASKLFRFGFWVIVEGLAFWVLVWGDNLIVARYLGSRDLGVYSLAWTISVIIFSSVSAPIYSISYPTFARLQDDMQTLKSTFLKANRLLISLSLPLGTGLLLVGPQIADVFFGAK